jgi:hypothetical protein
VAIRVSTGEVANDFQTLHRVEAADWLTRRALVSGVSGRVSELHFDEHCSVTARELPQASITGRLAAAFGSGERLRVVRHSDDTLELVELVSGSPTSPPKVLHDNAASVTECKFASDSDRFLACILGDSVVFNVEKGEALRLPGKANSIADFTSGN